MVGDRRLNVDPGSTSAPRGRSADTTRQAERSAADLVFPLAKGIGTAAYVEHYWRRLLEPQERREAGLGDALRGLALASALAKEEAALEGETSHVATGWRRLDAALGGGFAIPSLNLLGAAPKTGKSTWAQIVAERHVEGGGFVYYLDLEIGRRRFLRRLLCRRSRLGGSQVLARTIFHHHRQRCFTAPTLRSPPPQGREHARGLHPRTPVPPGEAT